VAFVICVTEATIAGFTTRVAALELDVLLAMLPGVLAFPGSTSCNVKEAGFAAVARGLAESTNEAASGTVGAAQFALTVPRPAGSAPKLTHHS
jgi:hypothetical protein